VRLILGKAKELLSRKSPSDEIDYRLNRVVERYLLSGKWAGSMLRLALFAPYGQVALPQEFRTLEGARVSTQAFGSGRVFELVNRWYRFLPGKGYTGDTLPTIEDFGDGEPVMAVPSLLPYLPSPNDYRDPITGGVLVPDFPPKVGLIQAFYTGATNYVVTMYGRDLNENPITLTLPDKAAYTNPFARIERIHTEQVPVTIGLVYTLPAPDSRAMTIAIIDGVQTETFYRRYFIPTLVDQANVAIEAFCKRRHLEFSNDQDTIPITNITALGLGLDAYQAESENDKTLANQLWADGIAVLNLELGDMHAADEVPAIRFHYPGHTRPQLTSHM
jgi:hypothetical protein